MSEFHDKKIEEAVGKAFAIASNIMEKLIAAGLGNKDDPHVMQRIHEVTVNLGHQLENDSDNPAQLLRAQLQILSDKNEYTFKQQAENRVVVEALARVLNIPLSMVIDGRSACA